MSTIGDFAATGAALLQLAARLARETRGQFTGVAGGVLVTARAYAEAGRNGFFAIGADETIPDPDRLSALTMGRLFAGAVGILATAFGTSGTVQVLTPLAGTPLPGQSLLADYFADAAPAVTVAPPAQAALDVLRRDPLLLNADAATIGSLMAAVADGVSLLA